MKKLFLFLLVLPLVFTACSDDDDKKSNDDKILGTWAYTGEGAKATTKNDPGNKLAKAIEEAYAYEEDEENPMLTTFNADKTFSVRYEDESEENASTGTYEIKGNKLTMKFDNDNSVAEDEQWTIEFSGNNLITSYDSTRDAIRDFEYDMSQGRFGDATIEKVIAMSYFVKK